MLRNYILVGLRNLRKQKLFSAINILGLTMGMTTSILILLWVSFETSVDQFHPDLNRIYKVYEWQTYSGDNAFPTYATPGALAPALKESYPEIEAAAQFTESWTNIVFTYKDKLFYENKGFFAGEEIFDILGFEFIAGKKEGSLTRPHTMVITRSIAEKYFGSDWMNQHVIGESILLTNTWQYEITAVVEDFPTNTAFDLTFIIPFQAIEEMWSWDSYMEWGSNYCSTFIKLVDGANPDDLDAKIRSYVKDRNEGSVVDLYLAEFSQSYLHKLEGGGRIQYVRIFTSIAVFILIIACINFMNLATAKSGIRSKEVGIRKSVGAHKKHLVLQFLTESTALSFFSLLLTICLIHLLLPAFNDLTGQQIELDYLTWKFPLLLTSITLITGILAGSYPAFYISSFKPTEVLKGVIRLKGSGLRKALVITQFVLSVGLIVSTLVVNQQLNLIQNKEIGFQKENIIFFEIADDFQRRYQLLKNRLADVPEIANVSASMQVPVEVYNSTSNINWPGKDPNDVILVNIMRVDYDYINTLNMELIEGRDFSKDFASDSTNYLVNESFAQLIGNDSPLDKELTMWGEKGNVVGVVKDFNFRSLASQIEPMVFRCDPEMVTTLVIRVDGSRFQHAISLVEEVWEDINPDLPFEFKFLDKQFEKVYRAETLTGKLFNIFSALAIFISCLGLFGLAAFTAETMKKEIGIRKVLGATIPGIIYLFSRIFTKWVIVANLIALPLSYFIMEEWLKDYAYRVRIDVWVFTLSAGISLLIALITVVYQSMRTAMSNPVESLRSE